MKPQKKEATTTKETGELIVIRNIRKEFFDLTIKGTGVLVTNNFYSKGLEELRGGRIASGDDISGATKRKKKTAKTAEEYERECQEAFEGARYRMADGSDGFPAVTIKYALVDAVGLIDGVTKTSVRAA